MFIEFRAAYRSLLRRLEKGNEMQKVLFCSSDLPRKRRRRGAGGREKREAGKGKKKKQIWRQNEHSSSLAFALARFFRPLDSFIQSLDPGGPRGLLLRHPYSSFMSSRWKITLSSCPYAGSIGLSAPGFRALSPGSGILRCRFLYNCCRPPRASEMVRPTPQLGWLCHRICHAGVFQE